MRWQEWGRASGGEHHSQSLHANENANAYPAFAFVLVHGHDVRVSGGGGDITPSKTSEVLSKFGFNV